MAQSRQPESLQAYNASAWGAITVTPSDTTVFVPVLRALYVGANGAVSVRMLDGNTVTFTNVQSGSVLPIQIDMVMQTGTSASALLGLY